MKNYVLEIDIPTGMRMRFGVPAEQPTLAIAALIELFSRMDNVVSAKLGLMEKVAEEGPGEFSYTVGLECLGNEEHTKGEILRVLQEVPGGRWPIAIVPSSFLTSEAIVFYARDKAPSSLHSKKRRGWLSRLFSSRNF